MKRFETIVKTTIEGNDIIVDIEDNTSFMNLAEQHVIKVIKTEDEMVRNALVKLGWTPPQEKSE